MMEKPVSSPMVPPMADNMSTNFAALSFVTLVNVGVSKKILTYLSLFFHSYSKNIPFLNFRYNQGYNAIHIFISTIIS